MIYYIIPTINPSNIDKFFLSKGDKERISRTVIMSDPSEDIFEKYNRGYEILKENREISPNDLIIFLHDDVTILDDEFEDTCEEYFKSKPRVGLVGVYGTKSFDHGGWWTNQRSMNGRGMILQKFANGKVGTMRDSYGDHSVVSIDGCFMVFRAKILEKVCFDNETLGGFHHYDADICFQMLSNTICDIEVTDKFKIYHESAGGFDEVEFYKSWQSLFEKWTSLGLKFPLTISSFNRSE